MRNRNIQWAFLLLLAFLVPAAIGQVISNFPSSAGNAGTVTGVTATLPITSTGGAAPDIGCTAASAGAGGCVVNTTGILIADAGWASNVASGVNAFQVLTNGGRIDVGAGASDYCSSDGTTVTFAGPVTATGALKGTTSVSVAGTNGPSMTFSQSAFITGTSAPLLLYASGSSGITETIRLDSARADAALQCVVVGTESASPNALSILFSIAKGIGSGANDASNGTSLYRVMGSGNIQLSSVLTWHAAVPSLTSFGGTGASIAGSGVAFDINVGTVAPGGTGTLTFATTATTGYNCHCENITNNATSVIGQTGSSTTTCVIANYVRTTGIAGNWTASDHLRCTVAAF